MATFDDLFGKKSSDQKYIKWSQIDEALYMVVTGEPDPRHPQIDFKSGKKKYMVQVNADSKWGPKQDGEFNPDHVENYFELTCIKVPVKVFRRVLPNGEDDASFEEFEADWIPTQDQEEKLKDQMLETRIPLSEGTVVAVKYLLDGKPRKYMVRLAESE